MNMTQPTDKTRLKVVACIPCFNTGPFIAGVVARAREHVDQVIVIDDGSKDGTAEAARVAGAVVIPHEANTGKGSAMKTAAAAANGADIIVFRDGDGAHDPRDIPTVVAPILGRQADFVIGSRALPGSRVPISLFRRRLSNNFASFVISAVISLLLPLATLLRCPVRWVRITDCTSGFRAIRQEAWENLVLSSRGFQIETEMIYEAARNELVITEVPISCDWSGKLSHLSIIRDGLKTAGLLCRKLLTHPGKRRAANA